MSEIPDLKRITVKVPTVSFNTVSLGTPGSPGQQGPEGKSAYQLALDTGFNGTLTEWLDSLRGLDGGDGIDGEQGESAYEIAVANGFQGTETQWLLSLKGEDGESAPGTPGDDGQDGEDGQDGAPGKSAYQIAVDAGFGGDVTAWLLSLKGQNGINGNDGEDGSSAYEVALDAGFVGNLNEWLLSIRGADGVDGQDGSDGEDGTNGTNGIDGTNGSNGQDGTNGIDGSDGVGVPTGGTTGQVLAKASNADFDTAWVPAPTGGGGGTFGFVDLATNPGPYAAGSLGRGADGVRYATAVGSDEPPVTIVTVETPSIETWALHSVQSVVDDEVIIVQGHSENGAAISPEVTNPNPQKFSIVFNAGGHLNDNSYQMGFFPQAPPGGANYDVRPPFNSGNSSFTGFEWEFYSDRISVIINGVVLIYLPTKGDSATWGSGTGEIAMSQKKDYVIEYEVIGGTALKLTWRNADKVYEYTGSIPGGFNTTNIRPAISSGSGGGFADLKVKGTAKVVALEYNDDWVVF